MERKINANLPKNSPAVFSVQRLVLSALFLAIGIILPFLTGQIPQIGNMLLPMHIPVILCGFICGWPCGLAVGLITPLFRSLMFGMPPIYPTAAAMAFELGAYGLFCGLFYKKFPKKIVYIYVTLIISMFLGRVVWGLVSTVLYGFAGKGFTWAVFIAGAFVNAIPGIILQIIIIPIIIGLLKRANLIL